MTATQYNTTEPTFRAIMDNYERKCEESAVSIDFCYNALMYKFQKYSHENNKIKLIERLDFSDKNKVKVLLNKALFGTKEAEMKLAKESFYAIKSDLFSFLNKTKDPYFFIMHPFYKYGLGIAHKSIPYQKDNMSGIQNVDIACDYALSVLSNDIW